jgi:hypothetical protein
MWSLTAAYQKYEYIFQNSEVAILEKKNLVHLHKFHWQFNAFELTTN